MHGERVRGDVVFDCKEARRQRSEVHETLRSVLDCELQYIKYTRSNSEIQITACYIVIFCLELQEAGRIPCPGKLGRKDFRCHEYLHLLKQICEISTSEQSLGMS